jgi:hypothetical protein
MSRSVEQNVHTNFSFPNPLSEPEELVLGMFKVSIMLDAIRLSFKKKTQQQQQFLSQFDSILDGHLARCLLAAPFRLEIENATQKHLIGSEPHSHKPFAPILLFLSQIERL